MPMPWHAQASLLELELWFLMVKTSTSIFNGPSWNLSALFLRQCGSWDRQWHRNASLKLVFNHSVTLLEWVEMMYALVLNSDPIDFRLTARNAKYVHWETNWSTLLASTVLQNLGLLFLEFRVVTEVEFRAFSDEMLFRIASQLLDERNFTWVQSYWQIWCCMLFWVCTVLLVTMADQNLEFWPIFILINFLSHAPLHVEHEGL